MEHTKTAQDKTAARDMCYVALFTALIAIMAQISIPMPAGVPLTLQTLAIPLAGLILGPRRGTLSTVIYVLIGAAGVPVFAGLKGGMGVVLGMTGGFLVSFPIMALLAGLGIAKGKTGMWLGLILGAVINYAVGTVWFMVIAHTGAAAALTACVIPFIPTAILKLVLAGLIGMMLRGVLIKNGLL